LRNLVQWLQAYWWLLAAFVLGTLWGIASWHDTRPFTSLPNPKLTPGEIADISPVCGPTDGLRHWSRERDNDVLRSYGIVAGPHPGYEIDHLVPLCLGGADTIKNLWPQLRKEAQAKDKLEAELCRMACKGEIDTAEAQEAIATNWIALYMTVFGELQL
jgi:hypothetical protein